MARAKGRDVILQLIESVGELEALGAEQTERFEVLAAHVGGMATHVAGIGAQVSALATQVNSLTTQVNAMAIQVNALALGARASQAQLGRVARLIVELASDHQRIEGLEVRVQKLERKAG